MSKRPINSDSRRDEERPDAFKKRRLNHAEQKVEAEQVDNAHHLTRLLVFEQGADDRAKKGIQSFKAFLESILYENDETRAQSRRTILEEFLEVQKPRDPSDKDALILPDLMQTWSYAAKTSLESLLSSIPAVLALLFKTLSGQLKLREYGIALCKTLLQTGQLKHISRGLAAEKHKEFLISPCLRLLTEMVGFDGGLYAKRVYRMRGFTFDTKTMARNLAHRKHTGVGEDKKKPSVRSNAVRYLLAHYRYQDVDVKTDILNAGNVTKELLDRIGDDPRSLAAEILSIVKANILSDRALPRKSKGEFLYVNGLAQIAGLYRAEQDANEVTPNQRPIDVVAHDFLIQACTVPESGLLLPGTSWYALNELSDHSFDIAPQGPVDVRLDIIERYERHEASIKVRNVALSKFIQNLRPYSNTMERELVLKIFTAAPELVADYFFKRTTFFFDPPKLTSTWIGYSSFLFETITLPVPTAALLKQPNNQVPPPSSIVIESILPRPLTQKALTRCLGQKEELVSLFAVRILAIAFEKLQVVLDFYTQQQNADSGLWEEASRLLVSEFCRRCPSMKDVINTFRSTSEHNIVQREAVSRLLALYYTVIPQTALDEKFDISQALTNALSRAGNIGLEPTEDDNMRLLELDHLVKIARRSPNMRWFNKAADTQYTAYTTLLSIVATSGSEAVSSEATQLLADVACENALLQQETASPAIDALLRSVKGAFEGDASSAVLEFMDECLMRLVRQPIVYEDDLDNLLRDQDAKRAGQNVQSVSLIVLTCLEQWPFASKRNHAERRAITRWLSVFISYLREIGEDKVVLDAVFDKLIHSSNDEQLQKVFSNSAKVFAPRVKGTEAQKEQATNEIQLPSPKVDKTPDLTPDVPPKEDERHAGLTRWLNKDPQEAIEEGIVGDLVLCLSSSHPEVRRQALANIKRLVTVIETSTYTEWQQVDLLLGELLESSENFIEDSPLPYVASIFAATAVRVLADPAHFMYPKINRFLLNGPSWVLDKLPGYWIAKIMRSNPSVDEAYHKEVDWLLNILLDGLRTLEDLQIYRKRGIFEHLMSFFASLYATDKEKKVIVRLLLRAISLDGGSTSLITRAAGFDWLRVLKSLKRQPQAVPDGLDVLLYKMSDKEKVDEWSNGNIKASLEG